MLLAANIKRAAQLLRISWDKAQHLMERAVVRGRAARGNTLPKQIGVDEKAIAKGHQYMTLVCNLEEATVEYIGDGRKEESLAAYFKAFGAERCAGIEAISLDMWPAFIGACEANMPGADQKMVFDRFHIMQHVGRGVDRVRRQEHKALMARGDNTLPVDTKANDLWHWQIEVNSPGLDSVASQLRASHYDFVSGGMIQMPANDSGFNRELMVRDPDGHALILMAH